MPGRKQEEGVVTPAKIVSRLDDKDLEHQHWVEGWPPAFRPVRVAERRI